MEKIKKYEYEVVIKCTGTMTARTKDSVIKFCNDLQHDLESSSEVIHLEVKEIER